MSGDIDTKAAVEQARDEVIAWFGARYEQQDRDLDAFEAAVRADERARLGVRS